jgi:hypothetical protein
MAAPCPTGIVIRDVYAPRDKISDIAWANMNNCFF